MAIYVFWGDDDFAMQRVVKGLCDRTLDSTWASFNYDKIAGDTADGVMQALNQAMTPPFGSGNRMIWLAETTLGQRCSESLLAELERTLPLIPETTVLLLTMNSKPDGRLKSTKLLQKLGEVREFATIPPWKTEELVQQVRQAAVEMGVKLTNPALQLLAEAVGNETRQLYNELEKLKLYVGEQQPIGEAAIAALVTTANRTSMQLAAVLKQGDTATALAIANDLFNRNEAALRIVATLVGQFRTWLWVKLMLDTGERDEREIARAAEISNPKRIYFLQKEVKSVSLRSLQQTLVLLLELEAGLKQGVDESILFQTKLIEICQLYRL
jgi:DNA polymerase-3 subunit delta